MTSEPFHIILMLPANQSGIVKLTVQPDLIVSVSLTYYPRDYFRQTSADIISLEHYHVNVHRLGNSSCCTPQFIPVNEHTASARLVANRGAVGNPCNLQPYSAGFILSIMIMLAGIYSIVT